MECDTQGMIGIKRAKKGKNGILQEFILLNLLPLIAVRWGKSLYEGEEDCKRYLGAGMHVAKFYLMLMDFGEEIKFELTSKLIIYIIGI